MLHFADNLIRQHLVNTIPGLTTGEVGFGPPNDDWRQRLGLSDRLLINVYLADLRENRTLRDSGPTRRSVPAPGGATVMDVPPPLRVDGHYLVSTWSPAAPGQPVEPTIDEHQLLSEVIAAFAETTPFTFANVYAGIGLPAGLPPALADTPLPLELLPPAGFERLADFWGTMGGDDSPARPVVYLVLTLPFLKPERVAGPMVTSLRGLFSPGQGAPHEEVFTFGGTVSDSTAPQPDGVPGPVPNAWIELLSETGRRIALQRSGPDGRFVFSGIPSGAYELRASADKLGSRIIDFSLSSEGSGFDLTF